MKRSPFRHPTLSSAAAGRRSVLAAAIASALLWAGPGHAQDYPSKPIRLVVAYSPGGGVDYTARAIAPRLGEALNTTVIVDNRAGASGTIGSDFVARSTPDGYTLLFAPASSMTASPQAMPKAPYNVLTDFAPVNLVGETPLLLAVRPALGVNNVKDLLQLSQKQKITLASAGAGGLTHLVIESLNLASKGNIIHVPYKGGGPALADAVAGHVDGLVADFPPLVPMFKEKRLVPVAVTSPKRAEFLPEVPTVGEDIPGFVAMSWYGVMAPAKTPRPVIDKLNAAIVKVMARDDVRAQLKAGSVSPNTLASPEAFQKFVAEDYARWGKLIRETHIVSTE